MAKLFDVCIEGSLPVVQQNGLNTNQAVDFSGAATVVLPAGTTIGGSSLTALGTITSSSAQALAVGLNGLTNPAFNVDSSTGSQAAGLNVVGATAAGTVAVAVISSGSNANLTLDAKGSGTIGIGTVSTGAISLGATTINLASATTVAGAGTGANGVILKNLKNTSNATVSGTAITVQILIGSTPYYFLVYPTSSA